MKKGEVYVYTNINGCRMMRRIDKVTETKWTSTIILCEYNRKYEGITETFSYQEGRLDGGSWERDEVAEVELLIKDYEV